MSHVTGYRVGLESGFIGNLGGGGLIGQVTV